MLNNNESITPLREACKIHQDARQMMHQASVSVREIAQFVGKATATMRAIPLAPLHYRALQMQMNSIFPLNYSQEEISNKYNTVLSLTSASKEDLQWWLTNVTALMGAPVCSPDPSIVVHSDITPKQKTGGNDLHMSCWQTIVDTMKVLFV